MNQQRGGRGEGVVTAERFGQGMTFEEYLVYIGTPENLARENGNWLRGKRMDFSSGLRAWAARLRLNDAQARAIRWLAAQPNGPAKILAISEEWSSDCRRDVSILACLAEAGGLDLRIFPRDGATFSRAPRANPDDSPNADLMNEFLRERDGQTFQSVPVAVFFTKDFRYLHHHVEMPDIYHKERLYTAMQVARTGESREQAWDRFLIDWRGLQESPFFPLWASATVDQILSALYERIVVGASA
jgi:hypothetical protein